jgi:hypothetical protein
MLARLGLAQPAGGVDVITRALGISALSVESLIILLGPLAVWLGRVLAIRPAAEARPAARRAPEYS